MSAASVRKLVATDGQEGTVGERLPLALAVLVTDVDGRPVQGAPVTFFSQSGGGTFVDTEGVESAQLQVLSDRQGLASATFRVGTDTSEDPIYLRRQEGDEFPTQALHHLVEVEVDSAAGSLLLPTPFEAIGYPAALARLRRTDPHADPQAFGEPGSWIDSIAILAEDRFGNPVSNAEVTFTAVDTARDPTCSNPPRDPHGAAVFDGHIGCGTALPVAGACGTPDLRVRSRASGVSVGVIAGNVIGRSHHVDVAASGAPAVPPLSFDYAQVYSHQSGTGECSVGDLLRIETTTLSDELGNNVQAALSGSGSWAVTFAVQTFVQERGTFSGPGGSYSGLHGDGRWVRITATEGAQVLVLDELFTVRLAGPPVVRVDHGGSMTPIVERPQARYSTTLFVGPEPALHAVSATGRRVYVGEDGSSPQILWTDFDLPVAQVWGVEPKILAIAPPVVELTPEGRTASAAMVSYATEPVDYAASLAEVEVLADGASIARATAERSGEGTVTLPRGFELDIAQSNAVQLVLNRGSAAEVRSDPFPVELGQGLFVGVSPSITLSQEVDVLNQRICARPDLFHYHLTREATVRLVFKGVVPLTDGTFEYDGSEVEILSGEMRAEGDHDEDILPSDLPAGLYEFELRGIATDNGQEEVERGFARSTLETRDFLSVGHTIVKGVDLFDGHLIVHREDLRIPGRGMPLSFARTYSSSAGGEPGELGLGWTHNWASKVVVTPCGEAIVVGGEGAGMRFVDDGAGGLRPLKGYHGTLIANAADSSFDFFTKSGTRYHYRFERGNEWQLESVVDPNGNTTQLVYGPSALVPGGKRLLGVVDEAGRRLDFAYAVRQFAFEQREVITQMTAPRACASPSSTTCGAI